MLKNIALIALGLALGAALGLYLGWVAWPTEFTDANPAVLSAAYRRDYALMTAVAYELDGDLEEARRRIAPLAENGEEYFFSVTLDAVLRGENETEIRQFARLAADLGLDSPAIAPFLPTKEEPDEP